MDAQKPRDNRSDPSLGRLLREARRRLGLTQVALAREVGCQQSALSMLEGGRRDAVAQATLAKLASRLGVALPGDVPTAAFEAGGGFCPNPECPANVPYTVGDEILFWPRASGALGATHCVSCGEVLASGCAACGAKLEAGACCVRCGTARIPPPEVAGDPAAWVEARRRAMAAWRDLI